MFLTVRPVVFHFENDILANNSQLNFDGGDDK